MQQKMVEIDRFAMFNLLLEVSKAYLSVPEARFDEIRIETGITKGVASKYLKDASKIGLVPSSKTKKNLETALLLLPFKAKYPLTNDQIKKLCNRSYYRDGYGKMLGYKKMFVKTKTERLADAHL
jgi:hypothetical protein